MSRRRNLSPSRSPSAASASSTEDVVRIAPMFYIHVLDNNTNVTRVEAGPQVFTKQEEERVTCAPQPFVVVPPDHYVVIKNPAITDADGKVVVGKNKAVKVAHGEEAIRFHCAPFPLYPGEEMVGKVSVLRLVPAHTALRLRYVRDSGDCKAGDEYIFPGPATYIPRVVEKVVEVVNATVVKPNEAIRVRAKNACEDINGVKRKAGEEWLIQKPGPYLPNVHEEIVVHVKPIVLTPKRAVHLKATQTFVDQFGVKHTAGAEWLVTNNQTTMYIPSVHEDVVGPVDSKTLSQRQYAIILDPVDKSTGKPMLGYKVLKRGPATFFLQPGEKLERGIQNVPLLADNEALLLRAEVEYNDGEETHMPGDLWMVKGPRAYVPPVQVTVVEKRASIPLDDNEGIYVRDIKSGKVRLVKGQSYMLSPQEELWAKPLAKDVAALLLAARGGLKLQKARAVTFKCRHNTAVRIYDYTLKKSRIVFGPNLVMLEPDEQITVWELSGGVPKKPRHAKTLSLPLGPDCLDDIFVVETSDHAKLRLKLAYNWFFDVSRNDQETAQKIFSVPDFVGDACKAIAGRIRGAVASVSFDKFHKGSADIIKAAVFKGEPQLRLDANNFVCTGIDIQSVEPVDQRTRDSLLNSVQKAISITTRSQEAKAKHQSRQQQQETRSLLDAQQLQLDSAAEAKKAELIRLQSATRTVEQTGEATAEAEANAKAKEIEGATEVLMANLSAKAAKIQTAADLEIQQKDQEVALGFQGELDKLDLHKESELAEIEANKFKAIIGAIGADTIEAIAQAGPEMQARLLKGLGLKSVLITDGKSPLNLFGAAKGMISTTGENAN